MKKELIETEDGSTSLYVPEMDETYHSKHGAWTESSHIFINHGFKLTDKSEVNILEIGFGTGLNALLTAHHALEESLPTKFHTLEAYPVSSRLVSELNFSKQFDEIYPNKPCFFNEIHQVDWEGWYKINDNFSIYKEEVKLLDWRPKDTYDIIYFDAFAPEKQPNMWSEEIFQQMFDVLNSGGILTTYCAKGVVKRMLKKAGFKVKNYPGPPGKREITVAFKE